MAFLRLCYCALIFLTIAHSAFSFDSLFGDGQDIIDTSLNDDLFLDDSVTNNVFSNDNLFLDQQEINASVDDNLLFANSFCSDGSGPFNKRD